MNLMPHMLASFTMLATTLQLRLHTSAPEFFGPRRFCRESLLKRDNTGISLLSAGHPSVRDRPEFASVNFTYRHNRNRNEAYRSRYLALQSVEQAVAFGWEAQANLNPVLQVILFQWSPHEKWQWKLQARIAEKVSHGKFEYICMFKSYCKHAISNILWTKNMTLRH